MMQPGELLGAVFGVLLNRLFPELLVVAILVLVLGLTSVQTLRKATKRFRAESADRAGDAALFDDPERAPAKEATAAPPTLAATTACTMAAENCTAGKANAQPRALSSTERREARQYPVEIWLALVLMMGFILLYSGVLNGWIGRGLAVCDGTTACTMAAENCTAGKANAQPRALSSTERRE